jgi:hypothetical protein
MRLNTPSGSSERTIVDRLVRTVLPGSIPPAQAVPDDEDDAAQDAPIVDPRHPVRQREVRIGPDSAFRYSIGPLISRSFPNKAVARARIAQAEASQRAALAEFDGTYREAQQRQKVS